MMGTYTTLEFTAQLNEQGVAIVEQFRSIMTSRAVGEGKGTIWSEIAKTSPAFAHYAMLPRCDFIPNGNDSLDGRTWEVHADLKNYDNEIETFLTEVLPYLITEPCRTESACDAWRNGDDPMVEVVHPK